MRLSLITTDDKFSLTQDGATLLICAMRIERQAAALTPMVFPGPLSEDPDFTDGLSHLAHQKGRDRRFTGRTYRLAFQT